MSTDPAAPVSRSQRKERTRAAILDTALTLCEEEPLAALSLRAIAKEVGIVPTAFYRHFESIEDLGLALVDLQHGTLREALREIRQACTDIDDPITLSIDTLIANLKSHPGSTVLWQIKERVAGPPPSPAGDVSWPRLGHA
ncbi:MAG: TetR family transcriptional regulator [Nocardioidaceae bacterium]